MFKILNRNREVVGLITSPINPIIEDNLTGMNELKFSVPATQKGLELEGYIRIENEHEYVIKEISTHGHNREVIAIMNVEELIGKVWTTFRSVDTYPTACIREIVAGTGWTVVDNCPPNKRRNLYGTQMSSWDLIFLACDVWGIEVKFDTHNKVITTQEKGGTDRGTYFMSDLNLKQLMHDAHTHKLITRVIPIGKDGLTIEKVNNGKNYIENHSYSNKVITGIWQSDRYTKAQDLMDDAREYLAEMCVPYESYECKVSDLYRLEKNPNFEFNVGDVIYLIDNITKKKIQQRIIKHTKNLTSPDKDTINLANKSMSFTDYYKRLQLISNMTEQAIGSDGLISSGSIESVEADKITGEITASNVKTNTIVSEHIKADQILAGHIKADQIYGEHIVSDEIDTRHLKADSIKAEHISAGEIDADHISADSIQSGHISTGAIHAGHVQAGSISSNHIQTNTISSGHLQTGSVDAGHIKAGVIDSSHISTQSITSDHIQTNSIKAEHLTSKSISSEHIQAGTIQTGHIQTGAITAGSGIIANGAIGSAQISSLDANKINAGEIDTSKVKIKGENGFLFIENNTLYVVDNNRKIRCELGVIENNSNYGFVVRGADGQTIMLDHRGVHNAGITDGAIDNRKVSENANISGKKLDIDSVVRSINEDGSVTLQGTKVQIGNTTLDVKLSEQNNLITEQGQRLATQQSEITANTNAIKLKVDNQTYTADKNEINTKLNKATSDISVMQGQIALKVEQTDIENAVDELEGTVDQKIKDAKAEIKVTTDSISQRVSSNESTTSTLSTKVTTIEGTANTANSNATNALNKANTATTTANSASTNATSALTKANSAIEKADDAKDTADTAIETAEGANTTAGNALSTANTASQKVVAVEKEVTSTKSKVATLETNLDSITQRVSSNETTTTTLTTTIETVKTTANNASTNASNALDKANTASTNASNAVTTANKANTTASTASTNATTALNTANNAKDTASSASTKADGAVSTANTAKSTADKAQTTANSANTLANTANNTANANKNNITTLQTTVTTTNNKVAELTTNLDGITQRVSSTESKLTTTTNKLNNLQVGGRNYINYGKGNEKQGFFANFSKVENGYGEHTLTSKKTYANIDIAGGFVLGVRDYEVGKQVTFSYEIMYTKWDFPSGANRSEFWIGQRYTNGTSTSTDGQWRSVTQHNLPEVGKDGCELNKWFKVEKTLTIPSQAHSSIGSASSIQFYNSNADVSASVTFRIRNVKIEYGNKATDWTPAIEDVDSSIASVDSKVQTTNNKVASIETNLNGITQRVSSTESTVSSHTTQLGTVDSRINTAKNSAISTASSDATTKANNALASAKTDATTKANNALADAKTYTNGQITTVNTTINNKVAEIKATTDAITQRVSSTEATTTTLTTKVNTAQSTADSATTKANNAQATANTANSTANTANAQATTNKNNISTLTTTVTNTNNKVSSLETNLSSITSRVSATETTLTNTTNKINNLQVGGRNLIKQSVVAGNGVTSSSYDKSTATWTLTANAGAGGTWGAGLVINGNSVRIPYGKTYVLSFEIKVPRACSWNIDVNNYAVTGSAWGGNDNDASSARATSSKSLVANQWIKCWSRISNTSSSNTNKVDIYDNSHFGVVMQNETSSMTYQIRNVQGEIGNIPSEYTPAPEDVQSQIDTAINTANTANSTANTNKSNISSLTTRVSNAETKLTKNSLTTTIGNHYTTSSDVNGIVTSKGYATTSQVQQTTNSLSAKFSSSGGYNLLRNTSFANGTTYWNLGATCTVDSSKKYGNNNSLKMVSSGATSAVWRGVNQRFVDNAPSGKTYRATLYYYVADKSTFNSNLALELKGRKTGATSESSFVSTSVSASNLVQGAWTKVTVTATTSVAWDYIYIYPWIHMNGTIWISNVIVTEGELEVPWSPHPSEIYDGITKIDKDGITVSQSNIATTTKMNANGFYINKGGTDVFKVDSSGLKMTGNITGSTFSSANNIFQVLSDGTVETDDINVSGTVSTDTLTVNKISNPRYPEVLDKAMTVYIKNGASSPDEFYHGAVYGSFKDMLAVAPRNLQGYTLNIVMQSNITENVSLNTFICGQVDLSFQGYTLYGNLFCYGASMVYRLYGGHGDDKKRGLIMPTTGRAMGSYHYCIVFQYCQFGVTNIGCYPDKTNGTNSGGIGVHRGATGNVFSVTAYGNMRYLVRAEYAGRVHVKTSSGTCNNATFCASAGGIITIDDSQKQAGRSTSGNPYWVGSGGCILNNQVLGMTNVTFNNTANAGTNNNTSGTTTQTVTETITASLADTYRSTVYNNWKKDGTVRQGDWGYGNCTGLWFFDNKLSSALSKGTTKSVSIKITRQSGGNSGAVTHTLKVHNHATRPSGAPTMGSTITTFSLATGASTTLNLTSAQINTLKSGKGIGLQSSYSNSTYSVCSGTITIKVTYTT